MLERFGIEYRRQQRPRKTDRHGEIKSTEKHGLIS
jgi:hypothetical protein